MIRFKIVRPRYESKWSLYEVKRGWFLRRWVWVTTLPTREACELVLRASLLEERGNEVHFYDAQGNGEGCCT